MKPQDLCKECEALDADGNTTNPLRCILCSAYINTQITNMYNELMTQKGCATCKHLRHASDLPGFVGNGEYGCEEGLRCEAINDSVKDCPKWVGGLYNGLSLGFSAPYEKED